MQRRKYQIKIILILGLLLSSPCVHAIERLGYVGQGWSFPVFFDPKKSTDEITYHFDMAYFLDESWTAEFSLNVQVGGMKQFYLEIGPDFYPMDDVMFLPFVSGRFLYAIAPGGSIGWQFNIGFEAPLGKSFQIQNLRVRASTGGGQFFFDDAAAGDTFFMELIRLGLIWNF